MAHQPEPAQVPAGDVRGGGVLREHDLFGGHRIDLVDTLVIFLELGTGAKSQIVRAEYAWTTYVANGLADACAAAAEKVSYLQDRSARHDRGEIQAPAFAPR